MISDARTRVLMKIYLLTDFRVIDALVLARQNGADVRAMIEAKPYGGSDSATLAYARLKNAGIPTRYANPVFRYTHEKSFVIDNDGVILTANMTKSAFSRNREFGIIVNTITEVDEIVVRSTLTGIARSLYLVIRFWYGVL